MRLLSLRNLFAASLIGAVAFVRAQADETSSGSAPLTLKSAGNSITWKHSAEGWKIASVSVGGSELQVPAGYYSIIYNPGRPNSSRVEANVDGTCLSFFPESATQEADGALVFRKTLRVAEVEARWKADPSSGDIAVSIDITARVKGVFSIATPTLAIISEDNLAWGMVPGDWYGTRLQPNYELAYRYSQDLPSVPVIAKEKTTETLCALMSTKNGITFAVVPDPGTAADPWAKDKYSRTDNGVGLATLDRHNELTPVAYSPVLGELNSATEEGQKRHFGFRYVLARGDWHAPFAHIVRDIYAFDSLLALQKNDISLSDRIRRLRAHVDDQKTANWSTWESEGLVIGSNGSKNADIGALLMLAKAGDDKVMQGQIPFVRNYKLAQQQMTPGFFQYAAAGEYGGKDGFNSEVGNWVEPMFTVQYTLVDMGNLLLFHPDDPQLRERMRLAAEKLISWQHADGSWDVAYDNYSHKLSFPMLTDYRATWYGLLVAYRMLGDPRYLAAAEKGADWLVREGVNKGLYLGQCGDARDISGICNSSKRQAFMDLYETTGKEMYKKAAVDCAWIYSTAIFTHPINTGAPRQVNGASVPDWKIEQTGLGVEHIRGTAAGSGPILITSFCGMFLRAYEMTKEPMFLSMARAAAHGRSAFVDPESGVSIYYWMDLDRVTARVKAVPHHAYWQIGWIIDYLMEEAKVRSDGKIAFPHGFMTPKVGPHVSYGFASGTIFGEKASLLIRSELVGCDDQDVEYVTALADDHKSLFVLAYNQSTMAKTAALEISPEKASLDGRIATEEARAVQGGLASARAGALNISLPPWGLGVYQIPIRDSH